MNARLIFALVLLPLMLAPLEGCRWRRGKKEAPPVQEDKDYNKSLQPGADALREVDASELPPLVTTPATRQQFKEAIKYSLTWLAKPASDEKYPVGDITKAQVVASLQELSRLIDSSTSDADFTSALRTRFRVLMSVGCDDQGTVLFTGYYTPIFDGSLVEDGSYRYPLYRKPLDLVPGKGDALAQQRGANGALTPYPSRQELEASGALRGTELVYLRDPFEAYIVGVQGSGKIRLPDGSQMEVGYDGTNNHQYHPIGMDLVNEGKITKDELSLATLRAYFKAHPDQLPQYTARNPRYVFFTRTKGGPFGSLGQRVTTNVTVATDKSIFPPGAPMLVKTRTGTSASDYAALRLDQDTGGAIRAPGRCDLYMGEGEEAERRAGSQFYEGRMYYLILRDAPGLE